MVNIPTQDTSEQEINISLGGLDVHLSYFPSAKYPLHNILFIFGHFGTVENYSALTRKLSSYGNVTVADLPGFNNRSSLYTIGAKPAINELAEYLATIVGYRYRKKNFTIIAVGYGVAIATRMLQRQSQIAKRVNYLISIDGFAHHDDLTTLNSAERKTYALQLRLASWRIPSLILRRTPLADKLVERVYGLKLKKPAHTTRKRLMDWHKHDYRTYVRTLSDLLVLDNCQKGVKVPFLQYWSNTLNCLDNEVTDQHLQIIFDNFKLLSSTQKISSRTDPIKAMYKVDLSKTLNRELTRLAKESLH